MKFNCDSSYAAEVLGAMRAPLGVGGVWGREASEHSPEGMMLKKRSEE